MRISCITLNNFSSLPLTRYFIQYFISLAPTELVQYSTPGEYEYDGLKKYTSLARFNNVHEALNQSRVTKLKKYATIIWRLATLTAHKNAIVYATDFQVIRYAILFRKIFRRKSWKIIYHQFETIERRLHTPRQNRIWSYLNRNEQFISLFIFPEKNRAAYFFKEAPGAAGRSIIFPNTCETAETVAKGRHEALKDIPPDAIVVGHVGNVGSDHYLEFFLRLLKQCAGSNIYFVMVGNYAQQVQDKLKEVNHPKLLLLHAVPHRELSGIYDSLDYGLILYRGVDVNFEYCAPNKLYEYWSYGIPVIAHQLQGLLPVFDHPLKGKLFNLELEESVQEAAAFIGKGKPVKKELQELFKETLDIQQVMQPVKNIINQWVQ